jgi:hypothetical protein
MCEVIRDAQITKQLIPEVVRVIRESDLILSESEARTAFGMAFRCKEPFPIGVDPMIAYLIFRNSERIPELRKWSYWQMVQEYAAAAARGERFYRVEL